MGTIKLISDSGSTKTDWALVTATGACAGPTVYHTQGINPFHQTEDAIAAILRDELLPQLPPVGGPLSIHFYGSGLRPELAPLMERLLRQAFPQATTVEAQGDLLGAARALCGRHEGLACILGTGANSCLYDGEKILQNTPPLGYILGDEGSGAVLGIRFLNGLFKGHLPAAIRDEFCAEYQLSMADVIARVYRQPMANRWMASLSEFIHRHIDHPDVRDLVITNFSDFLVRNVLPYQRCDLPVSAVGSIAYYYESELRHAAWLHGLTVGTVMRSPMPGLLAYHG